MRSFKLENKTFKSTTTAQPNEMGKLNRHLRLINSKIREYKKNLEIIILIISLIITLIRVLF
jgi:hypothetical protein